MAEKDVLWKDISVKVGWGVLRGKTCVVGKNQVDSALKVVCIHGWLDNANSFDTLVPHLQCNAQVLVLDLPGHGWSDHLPLGAHYDIFTHAFNVRMAVLKFGWDKFVLMGHSMGSAVCNYFTALFPEHVLAYISLDFIMPFNFLNSVEVWRTGAFDLFKAEEYENQAPLVYSEEEAIERMISARVLKITNEPSIEQEAAQILLPRSAKQVEGGYAWRHDQKARSTFTSVYGGKNWLDAISAVKCPVLIVQASKGICILPKTYYKKVLDAFRINARWFEHKYVDGGHHVHLTDPKKVSPIVSRFLRKVKSTHHKHHMSAKL